MTGDQFFVVVHPHFRIRTKLKKSYMAGTSVRASHLLRPLKDVGMRRNSADSISQIMRIISTNSTDKNQVTDSGENAYLINQILVK